MLRQIFLQLNPIQFFKVKCFTCHHATDMSTRKRSPHTQPSAGHFLLIIQQLKSYRFPFVLGVSYCWQGRQRTHEFHMSSTLYYFYLCTLSLGAFCSLVTSRFYLFSIRNVRGRKNSTFVQLRIPFDYFLAPSS